MIGDMYMKRNKILYMLIFPLILFLIIPNAFAEDLFAGDSTNFGGCGGNEWCFSSMGIRISLYTFDDNTETLTYYGSKDYNAYETRKLAGEAKYTKYRAGKVAYTSGKISLKPISKGSWSSNGKKLEEIIQEKIFSDYNNVEGNYDSTTLKNEIIQYFSLDSKDYGKITGQIKAVFGVTNINLNQAYITVEPTALIYNANKKNSERYYGTIYELAQVSKVNGHDGSNIQKNLFKFFLSQYNAIRAENPSAKVTDNKFLSRNSVDDNPYILAVNGSYNENGSKKDVEDLRDSNKGYGIGVFWVGEYASEQTCSNACPSYNLPCYSNYCESKSKNQTDKTNCMKKCGAKEPQFGCTSSSVTPKQSSSECSDPISSSKRTCKEYKSNYYTEICDESTTIKYSDDLPTTLISKKGGFNFSAKLNGTKKCTLNFNNNYYKYKYWMAYGDSGRREVLSKLSYFTDQNNFKNKKYSYEIESSDYIKFKDRQLEEIKTTKTEESKYTGYSKSDYTHSYSSTYKSVFELKPICYTLNDRETLLPGCNGDIKDYSTYYAVYNDSSSKKVNTYAYARKEGSGLSDTNTCYYLNIDDKDDLENDIDCVVTINDKSSFETASVTYKVITRGKNEEITSMKIGNKKASDNGTYSLRDLGYSESNSTIVDASITYLINGRAITKKCPVRVDTPNNSNNKEKCTTKYKPAEYDNIRKYCNDNWNTDEDGYTSYYECYKKCSANGRNNTCKTMYKINDTEGINNYCQHYYKSDGYKRVAMCINDCSTITGYSDYIYRPIATGMVDNKYSAFPNRKAGSNWIGYEELTEYDSFDNSVIYEIDLTPEKINKIKKDSIDKKNYINYNGKNSKGYYKSNYISTNSDIFTNTNGRSNGGGK